MHFLWPDEAEEGPEVAVAVLLDALVVRCVSLGPTGPSPSRRKASFCPASVDVFAWPMDLFDVTGRQVSRDIIWRGCWMYWVV